MNRYPQKLTAIRLDEVDCQICRSHGVFLYLLQNYYKFIEDFEIDDAWFECPICGQGYHQHFVTDSLATLHKAELN